MEFPELTWPMTTERLTFRPRTNDDAARLFEIRSTPGTDEWLQLRGQSWQEFRARIELATRQPNKLCLVGLLDGTVVAEVTLHRCDGWSQNYLQEANGSQIEFGYLVDPDVSGQGLATEAVNATLEIAFGQVGVRRVTAGCFADNQASRRVLERVGMRCEGYFVAESLHSTRGWLDGCSYAMLRDEWLNRSRPQSSADSR